MALTVGGLYAVGFYLLLQRSLMRVLIGVVVLGHGTNLLLQLVGGPPARVPIVGNSPPETFADPLPQALALTAVVITFALTTFLLALGYRSFSLIGHDEVQDDLEDRRIARTRRRRAAGADGDETATTTAPTTGRRNGGARTAPRGRAMTALARRCRCCCRSSAPRSRSSLGHVGARAAGHRPDHARRRRDRRGRAAGGGRPLRAGGRPRSAAGRRPVGIALVADRLSALLLLVSTLVALAVLVYAISQRIADYGRRMASSTFYPTYLVLSAGVSLAYLVGRPVHAVRVVRDHADRLVRAHHAADHRADDPRRHDLRDGQPAVVAAVPHRRRHGLRGDGDGEPRRPVRAGRHAAARPADRARA